MNEDKPLEILPWGMSEERMDRMASNRAAAHRGIKITLWMGAAFAAFCWYCVFAMGS